MVSNPADSFGNFAERSSSKWLRFPPDVLPMHVAEMDFEVAEPIRKTLARMVETSDLGYLGPLPALAGAFGSFASSRWGWQADGKQIKLATDVGVAAVEILRAVTVPGDKVLINSPVYSASFKWIEEVGAHPIDAPLVLDSGTWRLDLGAIETAFKEGTKVYLLCSPQNPVGRVGWSKRADSARTRSPEEMSEVWARFKAPPRSAGCRAASSGARWPTPRTLPCWGDSPSSLLTHGTGSHTQWLKSRSRGGNMLTPTCMPNGT